ncbi:MAG TPA: cohesin domain-containing protein [Candidatus Sumerlaeota bacterium]|nr:cohesin domain-containing protein [Candidatus Sumerlaeota bacterium]HRR32335.1 cohesin domain-containing protein [Candidatus Sumerlaeia bacterium]HON49391.1 cohesin domain-containing protein [Candidatus Sumerlaeota bacterium]HOR64860.1 cohesin domain-containing protein [Candidatus Sumerlaeota bacterium]HPL73014.1 cohesin domain-containing protein [Candidatus Sumerlaeota bacterium]
MRKQLFALVVVALCFSQILFAQTPAGSLSLSPATGTYPVGANIEVQVLIDSGGEPVKTCQTYINYDATALSITASGITVDEDVFDFKLIKKVDAAKSQVQIVYGCNETEPPVGNAILFATLKFKALKEGVTAVTFDQPNSRAQKSGAIDLIGAWNDGSYTIGGGPKKWEFTTDAEGWLNTGQVLPFDAPVYAHSATAPGTLNITCNSTNTYGFWYKDAAVDNIAADTLYRARFAVKSDQADKKMTPTFRLRYNASNFMQGDALTVNSLGEGEASPDDSAYKTYDLYFRPQHQAIGTGITGTLSFDLINVESEDAAVATLMLDWVQLDKMPIANAGTPTQVQLYTFDTGGEGWTNSGQIPLGTFDAPQFEWIEEGFGALAMQTVSNYCYGFWQNEQTQIAMDQAVLYQIRVKIGNEAIPAKVAAALPTIRVRFYDHEANQMVGTFQSPVWKTYEEPVTGGKDFAFDNYYAYFNNKYGMGGNLGVAVEVINLDSSAPAEVRYAVDEVEISTIAIPTF